MSQDLDDFGCFLYLLRTILWAHDEGRKYWATTVDSKAQTGQNACSAGAAGCTRMTTFWQGEKDNKQYKYGPEKVLSHRCYYGKNRKEKGQRGQGESWFCKVVRSRRKYVSTMTVERWKEWGVWVQGATWQAEARAYCRPHHLQARELNPKWCDLKQPQLFILLPTLQFG